MGAFFNNVVKAAMSRDITDPDRKDINIDKYTRLIFITVFISKIGWSELKSFYLFIEFCRRRVLERYVYFDVL